MKIMPSKLQQEIEQIQTDEKLKTIFTNEGGSVLLPELHPDIEREQLAGINLFTRTRWSEHCFGILIHIIEHREATA